MWRIDSRLQSEEFAGNTFNKVVLKLFILSTELHFIPLSLSSRNLETPKVLQM